MRKKNSKKHYRGKKIKKIIDCGKSQKLINPNEAAKTLGAEVITNLKRITKKD